MTARNRDVSDEGKRIRELESEVKQAHDFIEEIGRWGDFSAWLLGSYRPPWAKKHERAAKESLACATQGDPAEQEELERLRLAAVNRAEEAERQAARAESAESRVQELEGERDRLTKLLREQWARAEDAETTAIKLGRKWDEAESRLVRLEEALRQLVGIIEYPGRDDASLRTACEIARSALTHSTPPRSDG
jgi:hypothetical protein